MWRECPPSFVWYCKLQWGRINQHIWCIQLNRCLKPSRLTETGTSLLLGKTFFTQTTWRSPVSISTCESLFSAFKLVNDPLDCCNIERRRSKAKFWSGVFAESVYKLINMNHKHLLSCCVEILDSFNPRIHGVLEHLNSCLATKQVSKIFSF